VTSAEAALCEDAELLDVVPARPFDLEAYLDETGGTTEEQRALIRTGVARADAIGGRCGAAYLEEAALLLVTLVVLGGATELDDSVWWLLIELRDRFEA
jgi:hypothetical protein